MGKLQDALGFGGTPEWWHEGYGVHAETRGEAVFGGIVLAVDTAALLVFVLLCG